MPIYEHECEACNHIWEDLFSLNDPVPEECPNCKEKGKVKRLLSWCRGKVELTGREHIEQCRRDAQKIKNDALHKENELANLMGEDKYHQIMSQSKKGP
jgi:putative FmdB family regulatory protein